MNASDDREFTVVFTTQTCDTCGTTSHISRACDCGALTAGPDKHVESRRTLLRPLRTAPQHLAAADPITLADTLAVLDGWILWLFGELETVGSGHGDASGLIKCVEALRLLRSRIDRVPLLRPWVALWRPLTVVVDRLLAMADAYVGALEAPNPAAAQRNCARGQEALDQAAEAIHSLDGRLDRWQIPSSVRLPGILISRAEDAYEVTGAASLLDLDVKGRPLYERITGRSSPPMGIGVGLLLDTGHVADAFDEERFWASAVTAYGRLESEREAFRSLVADVRWQDHIQTTRSIYYDALLKAEGLIQALGDDRRMEAAAAIELGAVLTENVGAGLLRVLGGLRSNRPRRLLTQDYTSILQMARQDGLHELLLGFDPDIRRAHSHHDFRVLDDAVVLAGDRPRTVPDEVLVDTVLAALESSSALFAALDCALAEEDHAVPLDRVSELAPKDILRVMLAANGITDTKVEFKRDQVEVRGRSLGSVHIRPLTVVASLVPFLPLPTTSMRISLRTPGGTVDARGPITPFRRFASLEGLAKEAAHVELIARWRVRGKAVATQAQVRYWAALRAAELMGVGLEQAQLALDVLSLLGRRLKDRDLVEALEGFRAAKVASATRVPAPAIAKTRMLRLTTWLDAKLGPLNDGGPQLPPGPGGLTPA